MPSVPETRVAGRARLTLPQRALVPKPDAHDPVDYYYRLPTARLYRARLTLALALLGPQEFDSMLEVGYGSGIFLPQLARQSRRLTAVDIHDGARGVEAMLTGLGVSADIRQASLFDMPFPDGQFDALVCISVLEHIDDLADAFREFRRVLRPGGIAVLAFPVRNAVTNTFFRAVGYKPGDIHPSSHTDILAAARNIPGFAVEEESHFPKVLPLGLGAYAGCRCRAV